MRETIDGIVPPASAATRSGRRYVAQWLIDNEFWPVMTVASAEARINACLDPEKEQYLKISELIAIMLHFQRFTVLEMVADLAGRDVVLRNNEESVAAALERVRLMTHDIDNRLRERDEIIARLNIRGDAPPSAPMRYNK